MTPGNRAGGADDHHEVTCRRCRAAVSAMLDGEQLPEDGFVLRNHLPRCPDCRAFADRARGITAVARSWRDEDPQHTSADLLRVLLAEPAPAPGSGADGPSCALPHRHLRPVGNAACGCIPGCACGCQEGGRCRCDHAA